MIRKNTKAETKEVVVDEKRLRPKDVNLLVTDNTKARKVLSWKPSTLFDEGIRKTIEWYQNNGMLWGYEKHKWQWRY